MKHHEGEVEQNKLRTGKEKQNELLQFLFERCNPGQPRDRETPPGQMRMSSLRKSLNDKSDFRVLIEGSKTLVRSTP